MTSDENDRIVDKDENQSELDTDKNHNYVGISEFVLNNAPDPSSTYEWEELVGELDFDEIAASADHSKPQKLISTKHLRKVWCIDLDSSKKKLNVTIQRGVRTKNTRLIRNLDTCDRILRYKRLRDFSS